MTSTKAYVVQGLFFGDEGKGTITDALVRRHGIRLVVRSSGGCQAAHNVITDDGIHHTFAQYGAGSLAGADTLLTDDVLVDPLRLVREGEVLKPKLDQLGFSMPRVDIHEDALVITPFHAAFNRIKEAARGSGRHGSCGVGIGETASYALDHAANPEVILRIGDLDRPRLVEAKLRATRDHFKRKLPGLPDLEADFNPDIGLFYNEYAIDAIAHRYERHVHDAFHIIGTKEMHYLISSRDTVWEGAQGVLLDEHVGFHPHTTWSTVTLHNAVNTLMAAGVSDITKVGVLRAYGHRHGAGPFPSEDETLKQTITEAHNGANDWQGPFRIGALDMALLWYAVNSEILGGKLDQLAITHADILDRRKYWPIVIGYKSVTTPWEKVDREDWSKRERLTAALMGVRGFEDCEVMDLPKENVLSYIGSMLRTPIGIISRGPAYKDKTFL